MHTTTHNTTTTASAPTATEMRARKYAHAVDRYDNARARHTENALTFAVAFFTFAVAVAFVVLVHTASVSAFAFGSVGQTVTRGASFVVATIGTYVLAVTFGDVRRSRAHVRTTSKERNKARHEMLSAF